jgi:hypothetical protein
MEREETRETNCMQIDKASSLSHTRRRERERERERENGGHGPRLFSSFHFSPRQPPVPYHLPPRAARTPQNPHHREATDGRRTCASILTRRKKKKKKKKKEKKGKDLSFQCLSLSLSLSLAKIPLFFFLIINLVVF